MTEMTASDELVEALASMIVGELRRRRYVVDLATRVGRQAAVRLVEALAAVVSSSPESDTAMGLSRSRENEAASPATPEAIRAQMLDVADRMDQLGQHNQASGVRSSAPPATPEGGRALYDHGERCPHCGSIDRTVRFAVADGDGYGCLNAWHDTNHAPAPASPAETREGRALVAAYSNCAAEMRREARYQEERRRARSHPTDAGQRMRHAYARDRAHEMAGVFDLWAKQSAEKP